MLMRMRRRALAQLLKGRYAHKGGRTEAERARNVVAIATAYTREELLAEHGIGRITALEIEKWLELRGLQFRSPAPPRPNDPKASNLIGQA